MDRRRFLLTSLAGALAAPLAAEAQQAARMYRIGYLTPVPLWTPAAEAFKQGLRDLGYVEGRNIVIEARTANRRDGDLPKLAVELVAANVDIIVAATGMAALAAKRVTSTIPIVMTGSADAVAQGIVDSLQRPGGNVTGLTALTPELGPKRLEILREAIPRARTIVVLWCPEFPNNQVELDYIQAAAKVLRFSITLLEYRTPESWDAAIAVLQRARPDALFLVDCTSLPYPKILAFAIESRLPTMGAYAQITRARGLISYGADIAAMTRRAAVFVDKILRGTKPADLPVEQPTKFEIPINLKTAKALGLKIPPSLLARADQVIE
jgi:putative tryptophan/tyrosine transport system substrate-binding protein